MSDYDYVVSGRNVKVSLSMTLPAMQKQTRSSIPETDLNMVNSVWIRTYSSETKEATSDWKKINVTTTTMEFDDQEFTIDSKSGYSYIVAVANPDNNKGVWKDNPNAEPQALNTLLDAADTWDDFLNIAVVAPSTSEETLSPSVPLPMAGCYMPGLPPTAGGHPKTLGYYGEADFEPYFIPSNEGGTVTLSDGAIHLRRLMSHITFNMTPKSDLNLNVESFRLVNVPKYSWLYERPYNAAETNFGNLATEEKISTYYANDIEEFSSQYVSKNQDGSSSFDFWLSENKHTGTSTTYAQRGQQNSIGLFTSLTGETWTPNNLATYVVVTCTIDYKETIDVDENGVRDPLPPTESGPVYRTGNATYIIHLGYINGDGLSEGEKSKDFNCYRNVDYTYNVKVNGVNDIRLDAYAQGDFPNQEGIVVDLQERPKVLDAHYHAFNIQLTQSELEKNDFGFIIETYYGSSQSIFTETSSFDGIDENLYNWIELRATSDKYTLAYYKPRFGTNRNPDDNNTEYNGKETFLLAALKSTDPVNRGPYEDMKPEWVSPSGWYTVFVNEYTYEQIYTPESDQAGTYGDERQNGNDRWMHYVNRSPRRFYITTKKQVSEDGKTTYARSRCGVSQRSIQTYYSAIKPTAEETYTENGSTYTIPAGTAVGIERENEIEGINMRDTYGGGSDANNGRWNVAQYLSGQNRSATTLNINSTDNSALPLWSTFIRQTTPMTKDAVDDSRLQGGTPIVARGRDNPIYLPALVMLTGQTADWRDPQNSTEAIQSINACTSRNRDNNGNGRIDPEELRWYVPAMGKYLRLILGRHSLGETPLMQYSNIGTLPGSGARDFGNYPRYFFAGSNYMSSWDGNPHVQVLWGLEGMSTSEWGRWSGNPWQVRCLRNLGTDLRSVSKGHKVSMAYKRRPDTNIIEMAYYDLASVRPYKLAGNGEDSGQMPVHISTDQYNMVYTAFEFKPASDDRPMPSDSATLSLTPQYINSNNACRRYGLEWRLPNQSELAIMRNLGLFESNNDYHYWLSSTALYFNSRTGVGSDEYLSPYQELFVVNADKGIRMSENNFTEYYGEGIFIRCVRDVN